jgi:Nucleotidyl transferase AbiEii toxin, Type IV TA system
MVPLPYMNPEDRVRRYTERGFQRVEAQILVLIEESAVAIFTSFHDNFVLFGGAALVLFHDSPRLSRDLDLLTAPTALPTADQIQTVVRSGIQPLADAFGLGQFEFRNDAATPDFAKHWVLANGQPLFSIDLTGIAGSVLKTQIVKQSIASESEKIVLSPTANYLLLQKCEAFLNRRYLKVRDAFDIHLLARRGAHLDKSLHAHLEDFTTMREIDGEFIEDRIARTDKKSCTVALRPVLPASIFDELAEHEFERIRKSLRAVFSYWLGK